MKSEMEVDGAENVNGPPTQEQARQAQAGDDHRGSLSAP